TIFADVAEARATAVTMAVGLVRKLNPPPRACHHVCVREFRGPWGRESDGRQRLLVKQETRSTRRRSWKRLSS
ncbi:hypothetical protein CH063_11380, partial [Colletotrichum higginsianum]